MLTKQHTTSTPFCPLTQDLGMSNKLPYDLVFFFSGSQSSSILENKPSFSQSILTHKWSKNLKSSYLSYFFSHSSLLLLDVILFSETFSENSTLAKDEWVFKWRTIIRLLVVRPDVVEGSSTMFLMYEVSKILFSW